MRCLKIINKIWLKKNTIIFFSLILVILVFVLYYIKKNIKIENMQNNDLNEYVKLKIEDKEQRMFPYRYFQDENFKALPIVAVTGFFRDDKAKKMYYEYIKNGIFVFGITAYKSFPRLINNDDPYHLTDDFDYINNIKNWLVCFRDPSYYGFTDKNNCIDISESDIYDIDTTELPKKYDFIYICNKDSDDCPKDGWNAINRNYKLAEACFPILINEYNLKGLIVGRTGCGLEQKYGNKIEVSDWLDWFKLQDKMRECKFLFLPNIYDASPRVIAECITKGLPVLMNKSILCGFKYITYDTGEFFIDENDIRISLDLLLKKMDKINPKKWWEENYGKSRVTKKIKDFLYPSCPEILENVKEVHFIF
jgi:hypothetical protein